MTACIYCDRCWNCHEPLDRTRCLSMWGRPFVCDLLCWGKLRNLLEQTEQSMFRAMLRREIVQAPEPGK